MLSLILTFSPEEKEQRLRVSDFADGCPANPAARIFKVAADDSPSPWGEGRDEGGQKFNSATEWRTKVAHGFTVGSIIKRIKPRSGERKY